MLVPMPRRAFAREITGTSWNGFLWAGLAQRKTRAAKAGGNG